MKKIALIFILILLGGTSNSIAQSLNNYENEFDAAYAAYPNIPKGILEGVSFVQTRFTNIDHSEPGCIGLPTVQGVMGLTIDGQGYFNNTLSVIAEHSNTPLNEMGNPATDIMAYAKVYNDFVLENSMPLDDFSAHETILREMSEIPQDGNEVNNYALASFTYAVFQFMRDEENQAIYNLPAHPIDLESIYGEQNLKILSSKKVHISQEKVLDENGAQFQSQNKSLEYGPALWVATPTCNFSSRAGTAISAITIHTIQGSYAGAISWAQNCSSNVSYHYVVRSTDGQVTQMVYEADKGWHVGSANPYAIGIEHEGYVDNPAWYTVSLYTSSADLCKDITQSGYGINPLRTYFGPASTGLNTLGACTKIKGHQHFPSQSHTDPGINWDWEYFYQLINDNPTITTLSTASGTHYDSGGAGGDYSDDERELYLFQPTNVLSVTLNFVQFSLEQDWDYMYIYDGDEVTDPLIGVYTGTAIPSSITSTGAEILVEFRSDCATQDAGWEISWTSVPGPTPGDVVAPSTSVDVANIWHTTDFTANFTDADNSGGSGVHHKFYQVIDFDGTEWRANDDNGFFSDNFDVAIHPDWTQQVGTWGINSSVLQQTDELNTNTNIWANLDQDNYDQWLYQFSGQVSGTGGNKRAGFHFMCDDPTLTNRGNSYFIWLRTDDDKIQIYKTVSDVFTLEEDVPFVLNDNQWYDFKIVYDKTTGLIQFYLDDVLEASWLDPSPYTTGNSISMRSGDAIWDVNNLKVYHNRSSSELVTINAGNDVQQQNFDPSTHAAKVKTIAIDSAANVSSIGEQLVNVDWTEPLPIASINDGLAADISTITSNTEISANWSPTTDPNSDIAAYWYSIGTAPNLEDIVPYTSNWYSDTVTHSGLSLVEGTTYYVCVYAENGAGLISDTICSDGQMLVPPTATPEADFIIQNSYICSFEPVTVQNSSVDAQTYSWDAPGATPSTSTDANPTFAYTATGYYDITLTATGVGGTDTDVQTIFVNIDTIPEAEFSPSGNPVDISNAFVTFTNTSLHANGYLWDFGDGNISTDASPWHQFMAVGAYDVELVAVNGNCPNDTTSMVINVIDDLGLLNNLQGAEVYPNPATEELIIELNNAWTKNVTLEFLDARGRVVIKENYASPTKIQLNLINYNVHDGVYFLRLSDDEKVGSQKIIVKRG
jgi:PKD repeat protein/N-acetyl-anhydromuramyl-L-alanine amidase AmpD